MHSMTAKALHFAFWEEKSRLKSLVDFRSCYKGIFKMPSKNFRSISQEW